MIFPELSIAQYSIKIQDFQDYSFDFVSTCFVRRNRQICDIHEKCAEKETNLRNIRQ